MAELRSPSSAPEIDPLYEVVSHLGAILMQVDPAHDAIIIEHVQAAHQLALGLHRKAEKERTSA